MDWIGLNLSYEYPDWIGLGQQKKDPCPTLDWIRSDTIGLNQTRLDTFSWTRLAVFPKAGLQIGRRKDARRTKSP